MKKLNQFFLENPKTFRKVVINDLQIAIFNAVKKIGGNIRTVELHKSLDIKISQCTLNNNLRALCNKGYLTRIHKKIRVNAGEYFYSVS